MAFKEATLLCFFFQQTNILMRYFISNVSISNFILTKILYILIVKKFKWLYTAGTSKRKWKFSCRKPFVVSLVHNAQRRKVATRPTYTCSGFTVQVLNFGRM
jgi:hypothetical protein